MTHCYIFFPYKNIQHKHRRDFVVELSLRTREGFTQNHFVSQSKYHRRVGGGMKKYFCT